MYPGDNIGKGALIAVLVAIVVVVAAAAVYVFVLNKEDTPAAPPAVENRAKAALPDLTAFPGGTGWTMTIAHEVIGADMHYVRAEYTKGTDKIIIAVEAFNTTALADARVAQWKVDHSGWVASGFALYAIKVPSGIPSTGPDYLVFVNEFVIDILQFSGTDIAEADMITLVTNIYDKASLL